MITTPAISKRIGEYSKETRNFPAYVSIDGAPEEYIGSRPTQHDASLLASDYIIQWYSENTPEAAARLIMEELVTEGRHAELARDMGGVWNDTAYAHDLHLMADKALADYHAGRTTPLTPETMDAADARAASEGEAFYAGPPMTMDQVVEIAIALSSIPLPDEGRYRVHHTNPPCPCGGPSDHHPQRCKVIGQLMMPGPLPEPTLSEGEPTWLCPDCARLDHMCPGCVQTAKGGTLTSPICTAHGCTRPATRESLIPGLPTCDECHQAGLERLLADIRYTGPRCPSCSDQVATAGLCAACKESGEGVNWSERAIGLPLHWAV